MMMFLNKKGWIERCEITETYAFMEALENFDDLGSKWSSNELAQYLMLYMGGIKYLYHLKELVDLCYDITDVDLYAN